MDNLFDSIVESEAPDQTMFDGLLDEEYPKETPAIRSTAILTALARMSADKDVQIQMGQGALEDARAVLQQGREKELRYQLAGDRIQQSLAGLNNLRRDLGPMASQEDVESVGQAYANVLNWDYERKARVALEEAAVERIQDMASRGDSVQARVLLDNLQKGDANQTMRDYQAKMAILAQRAEELDEEYQQSGWGRAIFNFILNMVPTNYNFQRSGIVEGSNTGLFDWLQSGEGLRKQGETMWNLNLEDFAEYAKRDGELIEAIKENSSTIFGLTDDPAAAVHIMEALTLQTDADRRWANAWGIAEPAFLLPYKRIGSMTRTLVNAGAAREAVDNLAAAVRVLETEGPEAMARATGVTEREIVEETAVRAVSGETSEVVVPLAEQLATREEAARRALDELFQSPEMERANSLEEIKAMYDDKVKAIEEQIGRPIKDVQFKVEPLAGGGHVRYVEVIFGKKNGHGFANEATAKTAAKSAGLGGEAVEVVTTNTRVIDPKEGFDLKVYHGTDNEIEGALRPSTGGTMGKGVYVTDDTEVANLYAHEGTPNVRPLLVRSKKIFGQGKEEGWTLDEAYSAMDEIGISRAEFDEWKLTQNIEHLEYELTNGKIDSFTFFNELTNFLRRKAIDEGLDDHLDEAERLNEKIKAAGYEGRAQEMYGHREILVFDETNVVSQFEPVQTFRDTSGQWFVKARVNVPEQGFLTNPLHAPTQGFWSKMLGRFVRSAGRISDEALHGRAIAAGSYTNKAHNVIAREIDSTFKALPRKSYEAVQQIALKGATEEKWWTDAEFKFLMQRGYGREATETELSAYKKLQLYNDMDWALRNDMMYMDGVIKGKETVRFTTPWGREMDVDVKINYAPDTLPAERVYNMSDGVHYTRAHNPLSSTELDRLRTKGYVMLEFGDEAFDIPVGTQKIITNKVLVKRSDLDIVPLRRNQLPYTEGGHRMYTDKYFVKQGRKGRQADTGSEYLLSPNTFVTAANKADGQRWADVMEEARLLAARDEGVSAQELDDLVFKGDQAFPSGEEFLTKIDEGVINKDHPFEVVFDRDQPSMYKESSVDVTKFFNEDELGVNGYYRTTGRMYTSAKGAHLKDTTGKLAVTVDPYETLTTSLRQITRQNGLFSYKQESLERFRNTYGKYMSNVDPSWPSARILTEGRVKPDLDPAMVNQIESQRAAIINVMRFETPADKMRRELYQSTAEWVLGSGDNMARKFAHDAVWWFQERSPVQFLRGLAFDAKLGMFNIAQMLIQSSTMISATALSPRYGMKGMLGLMPMHGYLLSRGSEALLDTLSKRGVGKMMGFTTEKEFKEYARHMYKSGFTDMNGSHIMINDYGPTAHFGSFADRVNHFREQARIFFYTPETWNRLVAYRIAWGEAAEAGLKIGDPKFNSFVLKTADDYSMNMTQESAAHWQKGLLSIPTQFWAYNVRMMDAMFGKRFTPAQRARLIIANVGMAGSAGVPGLGALSYWLKSENGEGPDISTLQGVADRGVIDYLTYISTGSDVLIGERVGTGSWATDTIKALFGSSEYGEKSFMDIVGGATYSISKSTATTLSDVVKYAAAESGSDMGDMALTKDSFFKLLSEVSTFGNITKAIMINQYGIYKSKNGTILADDLPESDSVFVALSFRPAKADEIGYRMAYLKDKEDSVNEVAKQLRNWRQEAFHNPDKYQENMKKANVLLKLLPVADRAEVIKRTNRIMDDSFYDYLTTKVNEEKIKEGTNR